MILDAVTISGFRSIDGPLRIPVGAPTLLAGHNDAGKSAALDAIAFLLDGIKLSERDRTYSGIGPEGQQTRVNETVVEGEFSLRSSEQEVLGMPDTARFRRVYNESGTTLEVLTAVPVDDRLRDLSSQDVQSLKFRLQGLGLSDKGLKAELIDRLAALIPDAEKVEEWTAASADPVRQDGVRHQHC